MTNRANNAAGLAGGWGLLGMPFVDEGIGVSIIPLTSYAGAGASASKDYLRSLFEASARSPVTLFGYGVHAFNSSGAFASDGFDLAVKSAVNYAFENGVVQVAAMGEADSIGLGSSRPNFPANWDESWMIAVGESDENNNADHHGDYGWTLDLIAPSGDIICGCNGSCTMNWTTQTSDTKPDSTWNGPFAGTSAATPNVTGGAALVLSHFFRTGSLSRLLEPEDYQGILKAAAFRGDLDHLSDTSLRNSWVPRSGWGVLDMGKVATMLDTNLSNHLGGYKVLHYHFGEPGWDSLPEVHVGNWYFPDSLNSDSLMFFDVPFDPLLTGLGMDTAFKYHHRKYLFDTTDAHYYHAAFRFDTVTFVFSDPNADITVGTPMFAWGRSGRLEQHSGWSGDNPNFQTGFTRVISSTGGDSLNEGIFHSQSNIFRLITGRYYIWGKSSDGHFDTVLGVFPPDSLMGVNWTVYLRVDSLHQAGVAVSESKPVNGVNLQLDSRRAYLHARFNLPKPVPTIHFEIYDMIGRMVGQQDVPHPLEGWNETSLLTSSLSSGAYFCRLWGSGYEDSQEFSLVK